MLHIVEGGEGGEVRGIPSSFSASNLEGWKRVREGR